MYLNCRRDRRVIKVILSRYTVQADITIIAICIGLVCIRHERFA